MTRLNLYMPFVLNFSFYNTHSTTYNYDHLHIEQPLFSPRHGTYLANVKEEAFLAELKVIVAFWEEQHECLEH